MLPALGTIAALVIEAAPHAIRGAKAAIEVVTAGKEIYDAATAEGRDATDEEVARVRALRQDHYDDFFTDDEAEPT